MSKHQVSPLRGLTTIGYRADDLQAAKAWYTAFLGLAPYFDTPAYIEFRLGDYQHEFGILDSQYANRADPKKVGPAGTIVYWHVDDVQAVLERALAQGATLHEPPRDFGHGFVGATVIDPFGNILGLMYNPHYVEMLAAIKPEVEQ